MKRPTKKISGATVLDHEGGTRFYHRALSPRAKGKKRSKRKQAKTSRRKNRK